MASFFKPGIRRHSLPAYALLITCLKHYPVRYMNAFEEPGFLASSSFPHLHVFLCLSTESFLFSSRSVFFSTYLNLICVSDPWSTSSFLIPPAFIVCITDCNPYCSHLWLMGLLQLLGCLSSNWHIWHNIYNIYLQFKFIKFNLSSLKWLALLPGDYVAALSFRRGLDAQHIPASHLSPFLWWSSGLT
jgi:hypothetical protein